MMTSDHKYWFFNILLVKSKYYNNIKNTNSATNPTNLINFVFSLSYTNQNLSIQQLAVLSSTDTSTEARFILVQFYK